MVDITKPVYGTVWAETGEKLSPIEAKLQSGWVQEMMPYQYENFLQNRQDVAITYLFQKGVPEWSSEQEYIANKSVVTYFGNIYAASTTNTNTLPTDTTSWRRLSVTFESNGAIPISMGGTGATSASVVRTNLGLGTIATATAPITNGFVVRIAADTLVSRSITGTSNNIVVTNGDGVAGNININTGSNVALLNTDSSWTSTGSIRLPSGSTSQQGASTPGRVRFNLETDEFHGAYSDGWKVLAKPASAEQTPITDAGNFYTSPNVEGALQEVGLKASFVKDAILSYPDYAAASAAAATLPEGQSVEIEADETREGRRARYVVQSGALVFVDFTPDAIRLQSYAALRAYAGASPAVDITTPGISGRFMLDPADTTTSDNGGTVIVGHSGRRWRRIFDGQCNLRWWGAKGDNVSDDSAAISAWIAFVMLTGAIGFAPEGVWRANSGVVIDAAGAERKGFIIYGAGNQRTVFNVTSAPASTGGQAGQFSFFDSTGSSGGDIFYPTFRDFAVHGASTDAVAVFGKRDYTDAINTMVVRNVLFANSSTAAGCCALELNHVCQSDFDVVANCGGSGVGGDAIRLRQTQFSRLFVSAGNAYNAFRITGGYSFGNHIEVPDFEEVACCLAIDSPYATRNTFTGGQWVWQVEPFNCTAGANNVISNPNPGSGSFDAANKTGLVFDFPERTGTWTPTFSAATNPTTTYSVQAGYYVKRGRIVTLTGRVALSAFSGGSGTVSIAGLPFPTTNKTDARGGASVGWCNGVTVTGQLALVYAPGASSLALVQINAGASSFLNVSALSGSTDIRFTVTYETDAV